MFLSLCFHFVPPTWSVLSLLWTNKFFFGSFSLNFFVGYLVWFLTLFFVLNHGIIHLYIYILFWFVFGILSSLKVFSFKLGCFCSALNAWVLSPTLKCSFPSHLSLKCYKLHPVSLQAVRLLKCSLSCYQHYFHRLWYLSANLHPMLL